MRTMPFNPVAPPLRPRFIAVDWDGTLVHYDKYQGPGVYGRPVYSMVARIQKWLADGHEVVIFTSRVNVEHDMDVAMREHHMIAQSLLAMGLPALPITANKSHRFTEFWDDRAVPVKKNTGKVDVERKSI